VHSGSCPGCWSSWPSVTPILLIPVLYGIAGAYPFIESWVTGDKREHHLLDRPRNAPTRTALGVTAITFYLILFFASGNDLMAIKLHMSINDLTNFFRIGILLLPPLAFWVTKRICLSLQRHDRDKVLHGRESGTIIRTADGKFFEKHEELDAFERHVLVQHDPIERFVIESGVDANGVASPAARKDRARARLARFYFTDVVNPVTPEELAAAQAHGDHEAIGSGDGSGSLPRRSTSRSSASARRTSDLT